MGKPQGLLSVDGRQVLLYIPDQHVSVQEVRADPERGKRFHVADCETLESMRTQRRFERYVVTNNLGGEFRVFSSGWNRPSEEGTAQLMVCRNCLKKLNYQNYLHERKGAIWRDFDIARFFETYSTCFRSLPRRLATDDDSSGYTPDWGTISAEVRQACGFACAQCGVNLQVHKRLLHVHHVNGVKSDNRRANLRPLCADCHRRQPMHDHVFVSTQDMQLLTGLRRVQGIVAAGWDQALGLADTAVHGALMHARRVGFEAPVIGHEFSDRMGVVTGEVEVAWPEQRIAIGLIAGQVEVGWKVYDPVSFLEAFR